MRSNLRRVTLTLLVLINQPVAVIIKTIAGVNSFVAGTGGIAGGPLPIQAHLNSCLRAPVRAKVWLCVLVGVAITICIEPVTTIWKYCYGVGTSDALKVF